MNEAVIGKTPSRSEHARKCEPIIMYTRVPDPIGVIRGSRGRAVIIRDPSPSHSVARLNRNRTGIIDSATLADVNICRRRIRDLGNQKKRQNTSNDVARAQRYNSHKRFCSIPSCGGPHAGFRRNEWFLFLRLEKHQAVFGHNLFGMNQADFGTNRGLAALLAGKTGFW